MLWPICGPKLIGRKGQIEQAQGRLSIIWLDDLLREQLHELYGALPRHFSVGAFLFLLQRAAEKLSPYRQSRYWDLPKEQRPDYRLGFAIGEADYLEHILEAIRRITRYTRGMD